MIFGRQIKSKKTRLIDLESHEFKPRNSRILQTLREYNQEIHV